jgi:acyl-CoA synthetase (NDP forming)
MGVAAGAFMCLTPLLDDFLPEVGQIAVVTQSAAVGTSYVLAQLVARRLGVRYWIHTGNEADVTAADALDWFLEDSRVRSIILAFESLRELGRVTDAIERAASRGIVISTLRTARSPAGRVAAESHTAALIGRRSLVMEGACLQAGAYFGDSVHDLVDAAEGSLWIRPLRGKRVGVLTSSGGVGVMIADAVSEAGLKLPSPSAELRERLLSIAPYCHPANPVDATAQVINDPEVFGGLLNAMVESGEYDLLAVFLARAKLSDPRTRQLAEIAGRGRTAGHRVRICVTGFIWPDCLDLLHASGVAVFAEPIGMARALSGLERVRFGRRARPRIVASSPVRDLAGRLRTVAESGLVGELDSKQFLRDYGLTVIADCVASTPAEAVSAAAEVGYPVALKVSAAGLAHKAHAGGVRLGLRTATEVRAAARQLLRLELGAAPAGDGRRTLLVEPMRAGIEMFVGLTADPEVGPVVVCGWGGTSVETESLCDASPSPGATWTTSWRRPALAPRWERVPAAQPLRCSMSSTRSPASGRTRVTVCERST